jgi:hypothetical protein
VEAKKSAPRALRRAETRARHIGKGKEASKVVRQEI